MPGSASASSFQTATEVLAAVGTLAAAGFAAWSAWISRASSRAAEQSVEEARKARKAQLAPRLVFERDFLDMQFHWPHPDGLNGGPVFLARKTWQDQNPSPPTFSLTNHGESPALELQIVFDLEDGNGDLVVPELFKPMGLSIFDSPAPPGQRTFKTLSFRAPNGTGSGLPLYRRWTTDLPNCAPGQTRSVEFPQWLLCRLLVRGLQAWDRRGAEDAIKPIVLVVRIKAHTIEGEPYETQYRFEANPFWQGQSDPLYVSSHFRELPMYPVGDDLRVA